MLKYHQKPMKMKLTRDTPSNRICALANKTGLAWPWLGWAGVPGLGLDWLGLGLAWAWPGLAGPGLGLGWAWLGLGWAVLA